MLDYDQQAMFIAMNTVFAVPAVLLFVTRALLGKWYLFLAVLWTAMFLWSYFWLFPTTSCL